MAIAPFIVRIKFSLIMLHWSIPAVILVLWLLHYLHLSMKWKDKLDEQAHQYIEWKGKWQKRYMDQAASIENQLQDKLRDHTRGIQRPADVTLASFGFPSTEMVKKTLEILAEYNRRKQPKQKAWWEDVHTMD